MSRVSRHRFDILNKMAVYHSTGLVVLILAILVTMYFVYDTIQTPRCLRELTWEYNTLVSQFHVTVNETAVVYIHIGSKRDGMPVTIQRRTVLGDCMKTKKSTGVCPLLYVPATDVTDSQILPFTVYAYMRNAHIYIHRMVVREEYNEQTLLVKERNYIFDDSLDVDNDRENRQVSHPAMWIQGDEIAENQFYQLVISPAGLFTIVRIDAFKNIKGLPETAPVHREYKKTLHDITRT